MRGSRRIRLATALLVLALACGGSEPTNGPTPFDVGVAGDGELARVLDVLRARSGVPALGALLVRGGQVIEMAAVGLRASDHPERVTIQDRWHLGSMTKSMTSTLSAVLVEQQAITWSTTVAEVFPDLVGRMRSEYEDVRLEELLSHTAGLPADITRSPSWPTLRSDPDPLSVQRRRWVAELLEMAPEASRGTYLYANAGYVIAGSMLEEVTGESWEDLIQREIFTPLGMTSTGFGAPGLPGSPDQPWGHVFQNGGWQSIEPGVNADNPAAIGPAGTVHSTLGDYAAYLAAHLAGARGVGGLVTAASFEKLHTAAPGTNYALGWGVAERTWARGGTISHNGSNTLWYASVWIAPQRDFGMLAVTNARGPDATEAALLALIARFDAAFP
jgi:CubicO group peptidase (beta-lactamase class C family)